MTGVTVSPNGAPLPPLPAVDAPFFVGESFFLLGLLSLLAVLVGVALVGLVAPLLVDVVDCWGVDIAEVDPTAGVCLDRADLSLNTLPPPPAMFVDGLLRVLVAALVLPAPPRLDGEDGPSGCTCSLPHARSNAAKAWLVRDSQGTNSACLRLGVVFKLAIPPAFALALAIVAAAAVAA